MSTKLYVGNLSYEIENADLENLFSASGTVVTVNIVKDRDSGRVKGFGFVEMTNSSEANLAIENLNETEFMGRNIKVNLALENRNSRPRNDRRY
ncbi:MAG: RNA-binding protein [Deltaproteobacteria bacterium]|nr:MAG: RNA-binding protein [Deltaproteobacteria bacterium]TNF30553.1 MAG: RNA-binding protein [Deltaproteobacteria bacterium]